MRKYILLALMMLFSQLSQAQKGVDKVDKVINAVSNGIDSGKAAVKSAYAYADTSSTFKSMYKDFRNGIVAMAEALKTGVEHVWVILVRQQIVYAIVWLVMFVLFFIVLRLMIKFSKWFNEGDYGEGHMVGCVVGWIATAILFGVCIAHVDTIVTGFVNPEYGAMQDIVNMAKDVTSGKTQCQSCN